MIVAEKIEISKRWRAALWAPAASLMWMIVLGCDADIRSPPQSIEIQPDPVEADPNAPREETLGTTRPVHAAGDVYLAGQPAVEDLALMPAQGIKTVVSLRRDQEIAWAEEAAVKAADMEFIRIPFGGAEELTDDVFERTRAVLNDSSKHPLVLHCGVANRVGAVWLPYRVLDEGIDLDTAIREARKAGLRSQDLEEKALSYIARQRGGEDPTDATDSVDQADPTEPATPTNPSDDAFLETNDEGAEAAAP